MYIKDSNSGLDISSNSFRFRPSLYSFSTKELQEEIEKRKKEKAPFLIKSINEKLEELRDLGLLISGEGDCRELTKLELINDKLISF